MFEAAIFDVDGVVVDSPHEQAWREALRELLEGPWSDLAARSAWTPEAFTPRVYREHVSGRARDDGARAALEHFGLPSDDEHVAAYAERKQAMVVRLIEAGEFTAYPDAVRFALALKAAGLRIAAASSSKNARGLLARVRAGDGSVLDLLDADVSGRDFARGKPDPEMFLAAAAELGCAPERSIVVEDAIAGVRAGRAGGMAVIGVARHGEGGALREAGADLVVTSLDEVDVDALAAGRLRAR